MDYITQTESAFAALRGEYRERKKKAEKAVREWKWATFIWFDLQPLYFERHGLARGRRLRQAPLKPRNVVSCGLDEMGRVVVVREFDEVGFYETFYHWSPNAVEAARFDSSKKKKEPINLLVVQMDAGRPVASFAAASLGFSSEEYHWAGSCVDEIKVFHAARVGRKLAPLRFLHAAKAFYDAKDVLQRVEIHWPPSLPECTKVIVELAYEQRQNTKLDLRKDFAEIYDYVVRRVSAFNPRANKGPGKGGSVGRIDLGFAFEQSGWAAVVFDTRRRAEPDGEWTRYIDGNVLERPHWAVAAKVNENKTLKVLLQDGVERKLPPDSCDKLAELLGEMLKAVLLKARADAMLADLPRAARCELGVEEEEGRYAWPQYEMRGPDNLA